MNFPILIKKVNTEYVCGIDISNESITHYRFTFCIMSLDNKTKKPDKVEILQHFIYDNPNMKNQYIKSIHDFYNCTILLEE